MQYPVQRALGMSKAFPTVLISHLSNKFTASERNLSKVEMYNANVYVSNLYKRNVGKTRINS